MIRLERVSAPSAERDGHGVMLGALVCTCRECTLEKDAGLVILCAVSGNSLIMADKDGVRLPFGKEIVINGLNMIFVPPVAAPEKIAAALAPNDRRIHELTAELKTASDSEKRRISAERSELTTASLKAVHSLYSFTTITGRKIELTQISSQKLPPTGTGDCCAPKLLDYAFSHNLAPLSMDEVYYGKPSDARQNGVSYPPCDERCGIVLPEMLGLNIVYRDDYILVVDKPSGLLSVPGRGEDKQDCVVTRMKRLFPQTIEQPSVHRLDMETSGLLVLAFTEKSQRNLSIQFQEGKVFKQYDALLDGTLEKSKGLSVPEPGVTHGEMRLYFMLDWLNRPHQIYSEQNGKLEITEWEKKGYEWYRGADGKNRKVTHMLYTPHTGRTHQLRLASADMHGFGLPIVGDTLYGVCAPGEHLMLRATHLCFTHPATGKRMEFTVSF